MTEEEKIIETEKNREKYFYVDKEKTYQVLTGIGTSFIGASLALLLFAATHRPPEPPCGSNPFMQPPCKCKMMHKHGPRDFRRGHGEFRRGDGPRHEKFNGKSFMKKGDLKKFDKPQGNETQKLPPKKIDKD